MFCRKLLSPVKTMDVKITYQNNTGSQIAVERFRFRTPSEPWRVEEPKFVLQENSKLRILIESNKGNVPFETETGVGRHARINRKPWFVYASAGEQGVEDRL